MSTSIEHRYNRLRIKLKAHHLLLQKPYRHCHHQNLLGRMNTLQLILESEVSVSRFGDGELIMALLGKGIEFQKKSQELSIKLEQILRDNDPRVMVCLNNEFMNSQFIFWILEYERSKKDYIDYASIKRPNDIGILSREKEFIFYNECYKILFGNREPTLFGDATVFMLGLYYNEYRIEKLEEVKELFRKMVKGKRMLIACPASPLMEPSFLSLEKKLKLAGAKDIVYVDVPEKDSFGHYQHIKSNILNKTRFNTLWIQAGPAATLLAHDLATNHNILSYDIGSLNTTLQYIL